MHIYIYLNDNTPSIVQSSFLDTHDCVFVSVVILPKQCTLFTVQSFIWLVDKTFSLVFLIFGTQTEWNYLQYKGKEGMYDKKQLKIYAFMY